MSYKSQIILSQQKHDVDNPTPELYGERFAGDGFYGKSDGLHTVQYEVDSLEGSLVIQATLCFDPVETDWFTVIEKPYELLETRASGIENFIGNYVWIRAGVRNWTNGTIIVVRMNH